ncbi:hypothetical protein FY046_18075 [Erwinia sp. 1181_3]|nr:hypothetical protein [Erwinia rhapontici]
MFRFTSGFEQAENGKILPQVVQDHETLRSGDAMRQGQPELPLRFTVRRDVRPAPQSPLLPYSTD